MKNCLLVTIDVEALPARASEDHIERLIWGRHPEGTAGISEICDSLEDAGGKGLFFLEVAGSVENLAAYREINAFLTRRGHAVEWHYHPEILGRDFWRERGAKATTMRQDLFDKADADLILDFGLSQFRAITGRHPQAYRAGSFRWNEHTIDFLARKGIPYSFNACAETSAKPDYDTFSPASPKPFRWPNGVVEVPCGEYTHNGEVLHFRFPRRWSRGASAERLATNIAREADGLVNVLLHSWSFLQRTASGFYAYDGDARCPNLSRLLMTLGHSFVPISTLAALYESLGE